MKFISLLCLPLVLASTFAVSLNEERQARIFGLPNFPLPGNPGPAGSPALSPVNPGNPALSPVNPGNPGVGFPAIRGGNPAGNPVVGNPNGGNNPLFSISGGNTFIFAKAKAKAAKQG